MITYEFVDIHLKTQRGKTLHEAVGLPTFTADWGGRIYDISQGDRHLGHVRVIDEQQSAEWQLQK